MATRFVLPLFHLVTWGLILLCSLGFGSLVLRKYRFHNWAERVAFTITSGLGLCAFVLFLLALSRLFYQPLIWVLTVSGALATVSSVVYRNRQSLLAGTWRQDLSIRRWRSRLKLSHVIAASLALLALCYGLLLLTLSQYPPMLWDAISHHLILAREILVQHRPVVVPGIQAPISVPLNHTLFAWGFALSDDILAQMVEQTFYLLTAVGLFGWGVRQSHSGLGLTAAALWLLHPLVRLLGSVAYVDIALTTCVFLGIYALRLFWDHRNPLWWYLSMALLAMSAGIKILGLFFLGMSSLLGLLILVWTSRETHPNESTGKTSEGSEGIQSRFTLRSLILGGVLAFIILLPWFGFVTYHTWNPLWPILSEYSKPGWDAPSDQFFSSGFKHATFTKFIRLPVDWILYPHHFHAELNLTLFPVIVVWPIAWIVSFWNRSVRWWTIWALSYTVFWFLQVHQLRYWLPVLPFVTLALCESVEWLFQKWWKSPARRNAAWLIMAVMLILWGSQNVFHEIKARRPPPMRAAARETYLSILGGYVATKYVNERADKNDLVCVVNAPWLNYYFKTRVYDIWGPAGQVTSQWLATKNVEWIFIYLPASRLQNPESQVYAKWPKYEVVYKDNLIWILRRKPVQTDALTHQVFDIRRQSGDNFRFRKQADRSRKSELTLTKVKLTSYNL